MAVTARAEHVGSLLRPPSLLAARRSWATGGMSDREFKEVEDRAVKQAVSLQHEVGMPVVTDGEQRRESFQSQFTASCSGFEGLGIDAWVWGPWHSEDLGDLSVEKPRDLAVVERIRRRRSLAAEEFTYLRALTDRVAKVTLPSPTLLSSLWSPERSHGAYPRLEDFMADVVEVLADEARELQRLGCTYVQLDAPQYPLLVDTSWRSFYEDRVSSLSGGQGSLDWWLSYSVDLDNAVIAAAPAVTFGLHLCRGNQAGRWLVSGGYEMIAPGVFARVNAERLLLEYDDVRSGGFEPLELVPEDKVVVLGLVSTKTPRLEGLETLLSRLRQAERFVGRERLAVGTQCGFASSVVGGPLGPEDQRRKLALVVQAAEAGLGGAG